MDTREIPSSDWPQFLDQFSRAHQGQSAQVRTTGREWGVEPDAMNLPLIGVTDDRLAGEAESIRVMLGQPNGVHVDHAVAQPAHVRVAEWNDGFSAALQIESAEGFTTLLQIGPPEQLVDPGMMTDDYIG